MGCFFSVFKSAVTLPDDGVNLRTKDKCLSNAGPKEFSVGVGKGPPRCQASTVVITVIRQYSFRWQHVRVIISVILCNQTFMGPSRQIPQGKGVELTSVTPVHAQLL